MESVLICVLLEITLRDLLHFDCADLVLRDLRYGIQEGAGGQVGVPGGEVHGAEDEAGRDAVCQPRAGDELATARRDFDLVTLR